MFFLLIVFLYIFLSHKERTENKDMGTKWLIWFVFAIHMFEFQWLLFHNMFSIISAIFVLITAIWTYQAFIKYPINFKVLKELWGDLNE